MVTGWSEASVPIGSGNAYRHWYRKWYGVDGPHEGHWLQPYLVTAPDAAKLTDRVTRLEAAAGVAAPRISIPLRAQPGEHAQVQFYETNVLSQAMEGVIDTSMPLLRSGPGAAAARTVTPDIAGISRIVAIIDSDIAFAHPNFRRGNESAIAWFWDQDADAFDVMQTASSMQTTAFGRELVASDINDLVRDHRGDEHALYDTYREQSYVDPLFALPPSRFAHGTSVLDAAVDGLLGDPGLAIFAVQLPRFAVGQTQGHFLEVYLRLALDRISELASALGDHPEVYVNLSVGGHAGRHDGQSRLEALMDTMIGTGEVRGIFVAAGNSRETRTHARYRKEDWTRGGADDLVWRILGDDGTPSFLEIWLPDDRGGMGLTVAAPNGVSRAWSAAELIPGEFHELRDGDGAEIARLYIEDDPPPNLPDSQATPRRRIVLAVHHTSRIRKAAHCCIDGRPDLAGDWRIRLDTAGLADGAIITAWVARDEPIYRLHTGGRQSYFPGEKIDDDHPQRSGVVTDGTLSDLASGVNTIVVAAVRYTDLGPSEYSSEGIGEDDSVAGRDIFPTVAAVADQSRSLSGVLRAGFFAGSRVRLSGTSVAAPTALNEYLREIGPSVVPDGGPPEAPLNAKAAVEILALDSAPVLLGEAPDEKRLGKGTVGLRVRDRAPPGGGLSG